MSQSMLARSTAESMQAHARRPHRGTSRRRNQPFTARRSRAEARPRARALGEKAASVPPPARCPCRRRDACAARRRPRRPILVQIQHARDDARVVVAESVAMPAVERAGRIERIVALERVQPEEELGLSASRSAASACAARALRRASGVLVEPQDAIAANVAALDAAPPRPMPPRRNAPAASRRCAPLRSAAIAAAAETPLRPPSRAARSPRKSRVRPTRHRERPRRKGRHLIMRLASHHARRRSHSVTWSPDAHRDHRRRRFPRHPPRPQAARARKPDRRAGKTAICATGAARRGPGDRDRSARHRRRRRPRRSCASSSAS